MEWISIKDRLPKQGQPVDLWIGKRVTDYSLVKNYNGNKGNDFFYPLNSGISCIRYDGSTAYTQATHWMPIPKSPKNQ